MRKDNAYIRNIETMGRLVIKCHNAYMISIMGLGDKKGLRNSIWKYDVNCKFVDSNRGRISVLVVEDVMTRFWKI